MIETVLRDKIVRIQSEEFRRLLHFAEGFHAVLADFQRQCSADLVNAFLNQSCNLLQQPDPFRHRGRAPTWKRAARRRHRLIRLVSACEWKMAQYAALIDRAAPRVLL